MLSSPQFRCCQFVTAARLLLLSALLLTPQIAQGQTPRLAPLGAMPLVFGNKQFHLVSTPAQRVEASLSDTYTVSNLQARQWLIYAPDAPDTDDQSAAFSTLTVGNSQCHASTWSELAPDSSKLLTARLLNDSNLPVDVDSAEDIARGTQANLTATVTYTALLFQRKLVPGPPLSSPQALTPAERDSATRPSQTIDYDAPVFQKWLSAARLRRVPGERDLDFALRVFRYIRNAYVYKYDLAQDRRASSICQCASTDCGGLSQLFVATLRANGIPAVALCGRIARSAETGQSTSLGNVHVKSQFYAAGIGWVPVEMSGAVYDRSASERVYFGRTSGDFLTLSVGNDHTLSLGNGQVANQRGLQGIRLWVWGTPTIESLGAKAAAVTTRSTTSWSVRQLPIWTRGTQVADAFR